MKYEIKYEGIDGSTTERFGKLSDAAGYVRDRYLGPEYCQPGGLQLETGYLVFKGFAWSDIGKFRYEDYGREFDFIDFGTGAWKVVSLEDEGPGKALLGAFDTKSQGIDFGKGDYSATILIFGDEVVGYFTDGDYETAESVKERLEKLNAPAQDETFEDSPF